MTAKRTGERLSPTDVFVGRVVKSGRPLYAWAREVGLEPYRFSKALHGARPLQPRDWAALIRIGEKLGLAAHQVFEPVERLPVRGHHSPGPGQDAREEKDDPGG